MTEIEAKALALVNEVSDQHNDAESIYEVHRSVDIRAALCRAIEQHEAFKQEVSDALLNASGEPLERFIIPKSKPDPLVEVMKDLSWDEETAAEEWAKDLRATLEARGWEIREKGQ